jgi:hypothetical protein
MRGIYKASPPTLGDNDQAQALLDSAGNIKVSSNGSVASGATDSGNPVKVGGVFSSPAPTLTNGQRGDLQLTSSAELCVQIRSGGIAPAMVASGTDGTSNTSSVAAMRVVSRPETFNGTTWDRLKKANAVSHIASAAATTNATSAKASAGDLHTISAYNTTAAVKYLKVFNKASAPTTGTDTPVIVEAIPPNARLTVTYPNGGLYFSTGIAYALTGAAADLDNTALVAGDVVGVNISYS